MTDSVEVELQFATTDVPNESLHFSIDGEMFLARPWMTGIAFLRYAKQMTKGGLESAAMIDDFFRDSLDDAEYERFIKFCEDPSRNVTTTTLASIFEVLFARYAAGPTTEPTTRPTEPSQP